MVAVGEGFVFDSPAGFVQEFLEGGGPDSGVGVDVPFYHRPQRFHSRSGQVFERPRPVLRLVDRFMAEEFLAVVVPPPEIGVDFSPVHHVVPDHLQTRDLGPIPHHEGSDVLGAPLVEAEHPDLVAVASLGVVGELALVNLHGFVVVAQLRSLVVVLEVQVEQLPGPPVHVVHVLVLQVGDLVLLEVTVSLEGVKAAGEVVEDHPQDFHQAHVVEFENGPLPDVHFHIPALDAGALELEPVLLPRKRVYDAHELAASWAVAVLEEHALAEHPADGPPEVLGDPEDVQVPLEGHFDNVPPDHLVLRLANLEISEAGELLHGSGVGVHLALELLNVLVEEGDPVLVEIPDVGYAAVVFFILGMEHGIRIFADRVDAAAGDGGGHLGDHVVFV